MPTGTSAFLTDPSNNVGTIAPLGNVYTNEAFPILMASYHMSINGASGGTNLPNVPCGKVEIQNLSGNGVMWVGGVGQSAPYSGRGYELAPMGAGTTGEKTMYVNNANQISICALFSGQLISFMAYGNQTTVVIDPSTQGTAPNETVPMLSGTTPLSGSINNPSNTTITFTFSIPMDPNNISGLYVVTSGQANPATIGHLGGVITYFSGSTTATFQPNSGQLQLSGWYIPMADGSLDGFNGIHLNGGVAQSGGPFQIQGPPIVSGWTPLSGTTGVSGGQQVTVIFSQPMLASTINLSGIFVVSSGVSSPHVSGTVALLNSNPTTAQFTPISGQIGLSGITTSTWFIPIATSGCTDLYGNNLALTSGFPFESAAAASPPDTTKPVVSGTNPVSGATNVLVIPTIIATMSKSINSGFVTTSTVKVHDIQTGDTNVAGTVSLQSDLITIDWTPNSILGNLHLHRMELSGIQDLAGNFMVPFSGATFTTEPPLQVSGSTPVSGASSVSVSQVMELTMDRAVLSGTVSSSTCKLVDQNNNNVAIGSVSLTTDNLTIAFTTAAPLGYLVNYTYEISGVVDINNQQFMTPFSGANFTSTAPALTQVYSINGSNIEQFGPAQPGGDDGDIQGEAISSNSSPLYNKIIKQVQFTLQRTGNPAGSVTAGILPKGGGALKTTFGSIPCTSISTTKTSYTFTNLSASYAMAVDDNVVVEVTLSDMTNSNYISAFYNTGTTYTGTIYMIHFNNPAQFATENADITAAFWY